MPEKIAITRESGEVLNSNVVSIFMIPDTEKKYIITTENAVDPHGLTVLHVSEINDNNLTKVATDEEWNSIKTIMRAIISGNAGSYQYLPLITEGKAEGQYSRDISVSSSASKQMIDNYNNGRSLIEQEQQKEAEQPVTESLEPAPEGTTIFPEKQATDVDSEVSPGIAEVDAPTAETAPVVEQNPVPDSNPVAEQPTSSQESTPVVEQVAQQVVEQSAPAQTEQVEKTAPVAEPVQKSDSESTIVPEQTQEVQPVVEQTAETEPVPVMEQQVQVQEQPNNTITINFDAVPSFDPNATLDEVLVASQELFMSGVKNLVATMTEKIYRDLHEKEAELKERENILNEREKMINDQMSQILNDINNKTVPADGQVSVAEPIASEQVQNTEQVSEQTPVIV